MKFVLVRPAYASNLGSAARALTTMGFHELVLVQPTADPNSERAKALATHAQKVLDDVKIFSTLTEALNGVELTLAASHRHRRIEKPIINSLDLKSWVQGKGKEIALVFGPESTGLNLTELKLCDGIVTIPTACSQPSLNLAQAIMILAYELSDKRDLMKPSHIQRKEKNIEKNEYLYLKNRLISTLEKLDLKPDRYIKKIGDFQANDMCLLHDVLNKIDAIY